MNWSGLSLEGITIPTAGKKKNINTGFIEVVEFPAWFSNEEDAQAEAHSFLEKSRKEITSDLDVYLKKGEHLLLTAQKKPKEYSSLLEQCASFKSVRAAAVTNSAAIVKAVASCIFRPLLSEITPDMPLVEQQEKLDAIKAVYFPDQQIRLHICSKETLNELPACRKTAEKLATRPCIVDRKNAAKAVTIAAVSRDLICFGANIAVKSGWAKTMRRWKGGCQENFLIDDMSCVCAIAALMQELSMYLSSRRKELQEKGQENAFLPLDHTVQNLTECYITEGGNYTSWIRIIRNVIDDRKAYVLDTNPLVRPFVEAIADYKCYISAVSQDEACEIKSRELDPYELEWNKQVEGTGLTEYMDLLKNGVRTELFCTPSPGDASIRALDVSDHYTRYAAAYIHAMLPAVDQAKQARQTGEYALSYQTKKNIPKATLEYMQQSGYNNFFGYVEVDEDCDLEKISETYSVFVAFHEDALWWVKGSETVALRFRRLGNHKASGLYYPTIRCLCVSAVNPSSFIHEYGHMIDSLYGDLSQQPEFSGVRHAYETELRKFPKKSLGSGKYDINYFLEPTEIFARSLEIYFRRIRGYKNALLGECVGKEYPDAPEYMSLLASYFDALIAKNSDI